MAAAKKKSTVRKKTTAAGRRNTKRRKSRSSIDFPWKTELLLFLILAFCVVLFVSNIGKGGVVGDTLSRFFFGIFGFLSYPFPVILFFIAAFLISNRVSSSGRNVLSARAVMKLAAAIGFFLFICVFAQLVTKEGQIIPLRNAFADCAAHRNGGGIAGALIGNALIRGFGLVLTYVIDFIVLVFCVVLLTEKSLFKGVSRGGRTIYEKAAQRSSTRRERRTVLEPVADDFEETEERPSGRKRKKVSGVSFDTLVRSKKDKEKTERVREVNLADIIKEELKRSENKKRNTAADADTEPMMSRESSDFRNSPPEIHIPGEEAAQPQSPVPEEEKPEPVRHRRKTKQSAEETASEMSEIGRTIQKNEAEQPADYIFPDVSLLKKGDPNKMGDSRQHLQEMSAKLQKTLETFGVDARVTNVVCGPAVTQYEIHPEMGVKVSKILNLADDIKLNLAVSDIRIEAPIPGKAAIGIEVPNKENVTVAFRDLVESKEFQNHESMISFCTGKDIAGNVIVADIAKMPHLLIAGATGSGKSVCINTIIMSILYKANPKDVKLIMIDPKVVELSVYNNIPHLLIPVVTDPKKAAGALHWAVAEMTDRYNKFAEYGVRDIKGYNKKVASIADIEDENKPQKMPQIIVIVDELADLMMVAPGDVEDAICRLAQLARAAGIHLIIATQRPSVNVITGLIKANMPSRIAFAVTSGVDSRTILDMNGAEKLLGKGDMLFYPQNFSRPLRVQGAFVSDKEVADVVAWIIEKNGQVSYNPDIEQKVQNQESSMNGSGFTSSADERDTYFKEAGRFLIEKEKGSIGMLQRSFKIGFNRAARIMDQLEEAGVVGPEEGTKPRRVLMTMEEFEHLDENE